MSDPREEKKRPWWLSMNTVGGLLLLCVFGLSLYRVMHVHEQIFNPDEKLIRISHWQLELGYRDAMDDVIKEYEKLQAAKGHKVKVVQMPVTERVYGQWLNTCLISGQAPDICLLGMSNLVDNEQYVSRYFVPLTQIISKPNPYNQGTELANVPWRETFFDGMRGTYNTKLQDYFSVPTSMYNVRLFYNKRMFREATGSDQPPQTFGQLMDICAKIRILALKKQELIIPIAGSSYSVGMFQDKYQTAFLAGLEKDLDLNLDGWVSQQEVYIGFCNGKLSMDMPQVKALHGLMRRLCQEFGKGFSGKDRQTAAFEFVQQRAAMICTGSWDARSIFEPAKEAGFDVGIFDFPLPAKGEEFGDYVVGKATEASAGSAGAFGLYRYGRNFDQALDFLHFLTSKRINQMHMAKADWIPVVLGTQPTGRIAAFASDPIGFSARFDLAYGGSVS